MRKSTTLFLLAFILGATVTLFAQPSVSYSFLVNGLSAPVEVVNAGDGSGRLFIVEQSGAVKIYDAANGGLQAAPFMNISPRIIYGGERGLLSIAFHPDYETNGYFYAYYNRSGDGAITVSRFKVSASPNVADTASRIELLSITKPFDNHNGGHLQFAADGTLYFATGDGGGSNDPSNNAQNTLSRLGKMLRLRVFTNETPPYYEAPANNPFFGNAAYDNLIWAYGLRNPYRWSFDRLTGDMWIGDVGQGAKEEINYRPAASTGGENYGWKCFEGSIPNPCNPPLTNHVPPVYDYNNPANGPASVVGGYVYRGSQYPSLYGWYFAADVYSGNLYLLRNNGGGNFTSFVRTGLQNFVTGFGEGEDGALYLVSQGTGALYRLVDPTVLPVTLSHFMGRRLSGTTVLEWTTQREENVSAFLVEYSSDGSRFSEAGTVPATANGAPGYRFIHNTTSPTFYRLRVADRDGRTTYSPTIRLAAGKGNVRIWPTLVRNRQLQVQTDEPASLLQVVNSAGSVVVQRTLGNRAGWTAVDLPALPKGIYLVRVVVAGQPQVQRIALE